MRQHYLILKLEGPLQSWGQHSFEGLRQSAAFPGRSALLGLLAACLGIDRQDGERQGALARSVGFAVRCDHSDYQPQKMTDYHTVKDARVEYCGLKSHETIQTWREYWQDAKYTVAVWNLPEAAITLEQLQAAVQKPVYTPVLGRRSCPLARPLFESIQEAPDALTALARIEPVAGVVYSEEGASDGRQLQLRDVPIIRQPRQFANRRVFIQSLARPGQEHKQRGG